MALDSNIVGGASGAKANVDSDLQLLVRSNTDPAKAGATVVFYENDSSQGAAGETRRFFFQVPCRG